MIDKQKFADTLRGFASDSETEEDAKNLFDYMLTADESGGKAVLALLLVAFKNAGYTERPEHPDDIAMRLADLIELTYRPFGAPAIGGGWKIFCSNCTK